MQEYYVDSSMEMLEEGFLYKVSQTIVREAKRIVLASGVAILIMAAPLSTAVMNEHHSLPADEEVISQVDNTVAKCLAIHYQEPSSELLIMSSLNLHKGNLMSSEVKHAFSAVASDLGKLNAINVVSRWSSVHKTVSTVQELANGIELRSTWFADRMGKDVVFTIYQNGTEIITSRSESAYLAEQVAAMVENSKMYV